MKKAAAIGSKRGFGACKICFKEYSNRKKPKLCVCGNELGGNFAEKPVTPTFPEPSSVCIHNNLQDGKLLSVKITPQGDRRFCFIKNDYRICYSTKCLQYRASLVVSGKVSELQCEHMKFKETEALYIVDKFESHQIEKFTTDLLLQKELFCNHYPGIPTLVKISKKAFAVIGKAIAGSNIFYTHVMVNINKDGKTELHCTNPECKGRTTKQVSCPKICLHRNLVLLARSLKETKNIAGENAGVGVQPPRGACANSTTKDPVPAHLKNAIKIQTLKAIPYEIPTQILYGYYTLPVKYNERLVFQPDEDDCDLCHSKLGGPIFPQGTRTTDGNGYLLTNVHSFVKVDIKVKRCSNKDCKAVHVAFPYEKGLFNVCNKIIISLDILVEWRFHYKEKLPIYSVISAKLNALSCKMEEKQRPNYNEIKYLIDCLNDGFYKFEVLTKRDLNDVICGRCGIVGRVYFGKGNEKNCCTTKDIDLKSDIQSIGLVNQHQIISNNLEKCLEKIKWNLVERGTFATSRCSFSINIGEIPPMIPSKQRKEEINTELQKKSAYLKEPTTVEGDPIILSNLMFVHDIKVSDFDNMDQSFLVRLAEECKINTMNESRDTLKLRLIQLHSSLLAGISGCGEFVKTPGHTGGYYEITCPHGTTVCGKPMVLTESVRDAGDLWLSLKYPPTLFMCDTPCTLTHHVLNRLSGVAQKYFGVTHGCFEKPMIGKMPTRDINVPEIVPEEYHLQRGFQPESLDDFTHPLTNSSMRYICGDTFQSKHNPHKSLLCNYHNIDLCLQAGAIKKSYQESLFNRRQKMKSQTTSSNGPNNIMMHIFHNYLMNYYKNEEIVLRQKRELESSSGKNIKRDNFMRFVTCD